MTTMMSETESVYHNGHLDGVKARARDLLSCPLCNQTYKDPRVLPCQHTFCCCCLQSYIDAVVKAANAAPVRTTASPATVRRRPVGAFTCPACGVELGLPPCGASAFPVDDRIQRIRDLVVEEMARGISKRLGRPDVKSASGDEETTKNCMTSSSSTGSLGRQKHGVHRLSSHLGDISEDGGNFAADFDDEDANDDNSWSERHCTPSYEQFSRSRLGYSSLRETRHRRREKLDSMFTDNNNNSSSSSSNDDHNFRFQSPAATRRSDDADGGARRHDDSKYSEGASSRAKPFQQTRSFSQADIRETPPSPTVRPSVSTSSAFRNPYADDDSGSYTPIIGRHRAPIGGSASLRERRRRQASDLEKLFGNGADPSSFEQRWSADTDTGSRRFYVADNGDDLPDFMNRRQQQNRPSSKENTMPSDDLYIGKKKRSTNGWSGEMESRQAKTENGTARNSFDTEYTDIINNGQSRVRTGNDQSTMSDEHGKERNVKVDATSGKSSDVCLGQNSVDSSSRRAMKQGPAELFRIQEGILTDDGDKQEKRRKNVDSKRAKDDERTSVHMTRDMRGGNETVTQQLAENCTSTKGQHTEACTTGSDTTLNECDESQSRMKTVDDILISKCTVMASADRPSVLTPADESKQSCNPVVVDESQPEVNQTIPISPPSPRRPVSPTKESCFTRLSKFRQKSAAGPPSPPPRRRATSSTSSGGSSTDNTALTSPGPASPTRMSSTTLGSDSDAAAKWASLGSGSGAAAAERPTSPGIRLGSKGRVRKRPSLFVGTPFDGASTSETDGSDVKCASKTGAESTTVETSSVECFSTSVTSSAQNVRANSDLTRATDGRSNAAVRSPCENGVSWRSVSEVDVDGRTSSTSETNGLQGSASDDTFSISCPPTPAPSVIINRKQTPDDINDGPKSFLSGCRHAADDSQLPSVAIMSENEEDVVNAALDELDSVLDMQLETGSSRAEEDVIPLSEGVTNTCASNGSDSADSIVKTSSCWNTRQESDEVSASTPAETLEDNVDHVDTTSRETAVGGSLPTVSETSPSTDNDRHKRTCTSLTDELVETEMKPETMRISNSFDDDVIASGGGCANSPPTKRPRSSEHLERPETLTDTLPDRAASPSPRVSEEQRSANAFDEDASGDTSGFCMATGVTSFPDGSVVVADYGAGCLCMLPVANDAAENAGLGRVQHRLSGLKPFSVAFSPAGNDETGDGGLLYVGDRRRKTISVFDRYLSDVGQWPDNRFDWICGMTQLGNDLVIIDRSRPRHQLVTYSTDGRGPIAEFGPHGTGQAELCMAEFVAADPCRNLVLVADSGNHCVKAFDLRAGPTAVRRFGGEAAGRGTGNSGEMQWPKGIAVEQRTSSVFVADSRNGRVVVFDAVDGRCRGTAVGGLRCPYAVAVLPTLTAGQTHHGGSSTRLVVTTISLAGHSELGLYDVISTV